jgi:hypothetical protein
MGNVQSVIDFTGGRNILLPTVFYTRDSF